jgi:flagellar protein FlaG
MNLNPIPSATTAASVPESKPAAASANRAGAPVAPDAASAPRPPAAKPVNPDELKESIDAINRFLKVNSEVQFSIDDSSGQSVIKVVDTETKKILRQFPSQQALEIGKDFKGLKGLLIRGVA